MPARCAQFGRNKAATAASSIQSAPQFYLGTNLIISVESIDRQRFFGQHDRASIIGREQGAEEKLKQLSFQVSPIADFADMARKVMADGVPSEVRSDAVPGIWKSAGFRRSQGHYDRTVRGMAIYRLSLLLFCERPLCAVISTGRRNTLS